MINEEFYWLVGLIEGEGCFTREIQTKAGSQHPYYNIKILLGMTDRDIIDKAHKLFGCGSIWIDKRSQKKWKGNRGHLDFHILSISGNKAVDWMIKLQPFMGQRRQNRINELLEEKKLYPTKWTWNQERKEL